MVETMKKEFLDTYYFYFDVHGNLNPRCDLGDRQKFLKLCTGIKPGVSFGDIKTGEIHTREVCALRKELLEERFSIVYNEVFDDYGNVKACGREKCIELIEICSEINPYNYYGDSKQGFLNEENIFKLRWRVNA